jgi:hypothetical protein
METISNRLQESQSRFHLVEIPNRRWKSGVLSVALIAGAFLAMIQAAPVAMGQNKSPGQPTTPSKEELSKLQASMPSKEEISELLAKADEKISTFEQAVRIAKPQLDNIKEDYAKNYLDAASTAHALIQVTKQNGPSAYALVGILATIDDLSLDAANGSVFLLAADNQRLSQGKPPDMVAQSAVIGLSAAGTACNDIAELIFHATMRFLNVEEKILESLPN